MKDVYMDDVCPYCVMNEFFCSVSGCMCKRVGKTVSEIKLDKYL